MFHDSPLVADVFSASFSMTPLYYYRPKSEMVSKSHPEEKEKVLVVDPVPPKLSEMDSPLLVYEKAQSWFEAGQYENVIEHINRCISQDQLNVKLLTLLAKTYANQGKLNDAIAWCEKAIETDKLNPEFHHLRAVILQEQGKTESAVASLKRALYLDSNFVLAYYLLGNISHQIGKIKESKKYYHNALSLLKKHKKDDILTEFEGITAGRLTELIQMIVMKEHNA